LGTGLKALSCPRFIMRPRSTPTASY
jgi:hypothetical protein